MNVEVAEADALPRIFALERIAGYELYIGQWSIEQHTVEMRLGTSRYLIGVEDAEVAGFALLQGIGSACVHLKRIAVARTGEGLGKAFLPRILERCFGEYGAHRVELRAFTDNFRAQRAYLAAGFVDEGIQRDIHRTDSGEFRSMRMMSILKPEWKR